ncbi:UNVERIFIED_CONTAM: hypothetical protein K2H54_061815 [Gekko kuhli]
MSAGFPTSGLNSPESLKMEFPVQIKQEDDGEASSLGFRAVGGDFCTSHLTPPESLKMEFPLEVKQEGDREASLLGDGKDSEEETRLLGGPEQSEPNGVSVAAAEGIVLHGMEIHEIHGSRQKLECHANVCPVTTPSLSRNQSLVEASSCGKETGDAEAIEGSTLALQQERGM